MLHEGAKKVISEHGGSLPRSAKELLKIPGIGPYTAGIPTDLIGIGNVIRILVLIFV